MYVPKEFSVIDTRELTRFIAKHPFITLTTCVPNEFPIATHVPVVAIKEKDNWIFEGHLALANEQAQHIQIQSRALCVMLGPHSYVSSSVYGHENVPTWNYQAAHFYGRLEPLTEDELHQHLGELVHLFEKNREKPLNFAHFSPEMLASYKKDILGFRCIIERTEAAFKLSQNRDSTDHQAIIRDLEKCPIRGAKDIALAMRKKI